MVYNENRVKKGGMKMAENKETEVVKEESKTICGFSIAALVLGIVSLVLWCAWVVSIPCSILAIIFGILGIKKPGKGMAIAGIITGSIAFAIWVFAFCGAFMYGVMEGITESTSYHSSSIYLD